MTFDDDIILRVYKAWGPNCGLQIITDLTATLAAADSPHVIEFPSETADTLRVTAQCPVGGTATVSCDFGGRSQA